MSHFVLLGKHSISISRRDGQAMRVLKRDEESGAYLRLFYTVFTATLHHIHCYFIPYYGYFIPYYGYFTSSLGPNTALNG